MATINKSDNNLNELFGGKGFTEFFKIDSMEHVITFLPPPEHERFPESFNYKLPIHTIHNKKPVQMRVGCRGKHTCPVCKALKPTKWQRIKSWLKKKILRK